ncbi:MAG: hydroxymethylbilane synthase [Lachnospiraceae bacterium]|nr:hydroxymethylbilane synthase [Lachnospiraceae bacterium]
MQEKVKKTIRVGSRGSELAIRQAEMVMEKIRECYPEYEPSLVTVTTMGDEVADQPLSEIAGGGVFTKELERALAAGEIDIAVHSLKDMPVDVPESLPILGCMERGNPEDCLVLKKNSRIGATDSNVPTSRWGRKNPVKEIRGMGAEFCLGTSSPRREAQWKFLCPQSEVKSIRGNLATRLAKLDEEDYDGLLLARAGLERLGLADRISYTFQTDEMVPAVGQGILAVQGRRADGMSRFSRIFDGKTLLCALAERTFLKEMGGGCAAAVGAYAGLAAGHIRILGMVQTPDGMVRKNEIIGDIYDFGSGKISARDRETAVKVGKELAVSLKR